RSTRALVRTANVLAETAAGDPSTVVIAGAHLDTVKCTAGANDNASGAAALLETALQMARVPPRNKVRFAFWAGEEDGLKGSTTYVDRLSGSELARIAVYLNFDMIASPNHVFGVFTGTPRRS
ncbi:MAG: M28 family peptidase, partial [Comamonadaceae bacterium]